MTNDYFDELLGVFLVHVDALAGLLAEKFFLKLDEHLELQRSEVRGQKSESTRVFCLSWDGQRGWVTLVARRLCECPPRSGRHGQLERVEPTLRCGGRHTLLEDSEFVDGLKAAVGLDVNQERKDLIRALLDRGELSLVGRAALEQAFPNAPNVMIQAAAFHVFTDGVEAAAEWLAGLERFLRDPRIGIDEGATSHLLYHLYNWQQFQSILPAGRDGVLELLQNAKQFLAEEDPNALRRVLDELEKLFSGNMDPPRIE